MSYLFIPHLRNDCYPLHTMQFFNVIITYLQPRENVTAILLDHNHTPPPGIQYRTCRHIIQPLIDSKHRAIFFITKYRIGLDIFGNGILISHIIKRTITIPTL